MLSADHSVCTRIIRKSSTPDIFSIYLKNVIYISIFCQKSLFPFSGTPPTNNKILNLNFLEFGTDIFEDFFMVIYITQLCALALK